MVFALKPRVGNITALQPNWRDGIEVQYQFKTSILTAFDGTEQRAAMRELPRMEVSFEAILLEGMIHRHAADLTKDPDALFVLPLYWRRVAVVSAAGSTLTLADAPFWLVPGARLVLDGATQEAVTIQSVAGAVVTLQSALVGAFGPGDLALPAVLARVDTETDLRLPTTRVATTSARLIMDPGSDLMVAPVIVPASFRGMDVFTTRPNWAAAPTITFTSGRETFDPGRGRIAAANPLAFTPRTLKLGFSEFTAVKAEAFIAFFLRTKGQRGAFRMPTWQTDMRARIAAAAGTSAIEIEGSDFAEAYAGDPSLDCVSVDQGGAVTLAKVTSISITAGGHSRLNLADPLPVPIAAGEALSWCPAWRWATDILTVNWRTDEAAELEMAVRTISGEGL